MAQAANVWDRYNISINALSKKTLESISSSLNASKILLEHERIRNWIGLAELMNISNELINQLKDSQDNDKTQKIFQEWKKDSNSTITQLLHYLEELDRFDVIDDIIDFLDNDIQEYKEQLSNADNIEKVDDDKQILTIQDVERMCNGLEPQDYDAFLLFADNDINFANEVIEKMEQRNLKLCMKDRDIVCGAFEHEAIITLIAKRCNRLIIIMSQSFCNTYNMFLVSFAQTIGLERNQRKVLPITKSECAVPLVLRGIYMLDARREFGDFWEKLYKSILSTSIRQN